MSCVLSNSYRVMAGLTEKVCYLSGKDIHKGIYADSKESACNVGDPGLSPRLGRSPGEGNGTPLQHSCLENFRDRGARRATVHGVVESDMPERLALLLHCTHTAHSLCCTVETHTLQGSYTPIKVK